MSILNLVMSQPATVYISLAAFGLGVLNLTLSRLSERKRDRLQQRADKLEENRLLDKAWESLYGTDGFQSTKSYQTQVAAESFIDQAVEIAGESVRTLRLKGHLYRLRGNLLAANKNYRASLELEPNNSWTLKAIGDITDDDQSATNLYLQSLESDPDNAWSHFGLAQRLSKLGRKEEAHEHFLRASELEPKEVEILNAKADFLRRNRQYEAASEIYQRAIKLNPTNVDSLVGFGQVLNDQNNTEEAVAWILRAARCAPNDSHPYAMIAAIYADRNRPMEALEFIEKAIEMDTTRHLPTDVAQELKLEMQALLNSQQSGLDA
jgi:tetratricopeptide (TPR) repeat protein